MSNNHREKIKEECLSKSDKHFCILEELATGTGKTKIAIDLINKLNAQLGELNILICVYQKTQMVTWKDEFNKWGISNNKITLICYNSLYKHINKNIDVVILDECHHMRSEIKRKILKQINIKNKLICLSATIPKKLKDWFNTNYNTGIVECSTQTAIDNKILPDPEIWLVELKLDNTKKDCLFEINKKAVNKPIYIDYSQLWEYKKNKVHAFVRCTQYQYNKEISGLISWYKQKANTSFAFKNLYVKTCGERLKFLAIAKNEQVLYILNKLKNYRTVTFCNNIEQTEYLGKYTIHSKNRNSQKNLQDFNNKKIKHITACNCLNESVNLTDCKYGIFANINSSETIQIQRVGRALRHKKPVIIIPFFKNTREEEIVVKWMENYNKDLIKHYEIK